MQHGDGVISRLPSNTMMRPAQVRFTTLMAEVPNISLLYVHTRVAACTPFSGRAKDEDDIGLVVNTLRKYYVFRLDEKCTLAAQVINLNETMNIRTTICDVK